MRAVALTIAGSDPSGGAGLQSDLRTFNSLGVAGLSVVTSITVQSSLGVESVHPVDHALLKKQLGGILRDTVPNVIKVGMLGGAEQVSAVASSLERLTSTTIVLDPVLSSKGGTPLLDTPGRYLLLTTLMPMCDLITPNLDEAEALTGIKVRDQSSMIRSGEILLSMGAKAVLVKGGHLEAAPCDWLIRKNFLPVEYPAERIRSENTHGTGCLLSSTIAALIALGDQLPTAVAKAKVILSNALLTPVVIGKGRGYPSICGDPQSATGGERSHADRLELLHGIYVVTDRKAQRGRSMEDVVLSALRGGANIIQLRDKESETSDLVRLAKQLNQLVRSFGKLFIVNDRVDVAIASDADGVHLGPDDMHPRDVRRLLGSDKIVGVSTGTVKEAMAAAPYASYLGVGCIFGTRTKLDAGDPVGTNRIVEIKQAVPGIPTVAIGGISDTNIGEIVKSGATSAAIVSAIVGADDIEGKTRTLVSYFA